MEHNGCKSCPFGDHSEHIGRTGATVFSFARDISVLFRRISYKVRGDDSTDHCN
jgi:hypothetical protein